MRYSIAKLKYIKSKHQRSFFVMTFISLLLIGLSGCSRPYTKAMQAGLDTKPVESKTANIPPIPFTGEELEFKINSDSPTFNFDFGKSYVSLVKLPAHNPEQVLKINSICECVGFTKSIFIPIVAVLDNDFNTTKHLNFRTKSPTGFTAASYEGFTTLAPEDRYLFVYSDPRKYGEYADHVSAPMTWNTSTYSKSGSTVYKTTTYHSQQVGLWWRGSAVGVFSLSLIGASELDDMLK
jgi:hypothetical protein